MIRSLKIALLTVVSIGAFSLQAEESAPGRRDPSLPTKMPSTTPNRSIYLNGVDISSARNQDLKNVQVKVSENGDIYIAAPQYQVTEEETFMPLSSYGGRTGAPEHRAPQELSGPFSTKSAKLSPEAAAEPAAGAPATPASPATPTAPASPAPPKSGG